MEFWIKHINKKRIIVFIKWNWANEAKMCKGARMTLDYVIMSYMRVGIYTYKTSENEHNAIWLQVTMYNIYGNSCIQRIVFF